MVVRPLTAWAITHLADLCLSNRGWEWGGGIGQTVRERRHASSAA